MPTFNSQTLIDQLQSDVRRMILQAQQWQQRSDEDLLKNPENGGWSPMQVLQHLNIYSAYYLPAMEKVMLGPSRQQNDNFHSGWIGNWFTNLMAVDEKGKVRTKMEFALDIRCFSARSTPVAQPASDCPFGGFGQAAGTGVHLSLDEDQTRRYVSLSHRPPAAACGADRAGAGAHCARTVCDYGGLFGRCARISWDWL